MGKRALSSNNKDSLPPAKRMPVIQKKEESHPSDWTDSNHYGQCGQSCPCCRSVIEGATGIGTCPICNN